MKKNTLERALAGLALAMLSLAAASCSKVVAPVKPTTVNTGSADFSRYVAIGNSLTAGYQSGGLLDSYQDHAYPVLISTQAGRPGMRHPRATSPGFPALLRLDFDHPTGTLLPFSIVASNGTGVLENPGDAPFQNLGVPGARIEDFFAHHTDDFFPFVLHGQEDASLWTALKAQRPTFVTFWLGSNNALGALLAGTPDALTPAAQFESDYRAALDSVLSTGARVAVGSLAEVTDIPFANTIPPYLFDPVSGAPVLLGGQTYPFLGQRDGAAPGSMNPGSVVTLGAVVYLAQGYGIPRFLGGNGQPLPDQVVLTPAELASIRQRVAAYNEIIARLARERGVTVVDMHTFYSRIRSEGYNLGGIPYSTRYLFGGIFSLDGIHPSSFGQALVANEWIRVINDGYGAHLEPVSLAPFVVSGATKMVVAAGAPAKPESVRTWAQALRGVDWDRIARTEGARAR